MNIAGIGCLLLSLTLFAVPVQATNSDVGKERRWAEQVLDGLLDGDETWLSDPGGHEFLGVLTEGDTASGRAVLLLHGIGVHPNWPDVIYPLRSGLLEAGVTTLSIQMPVLPNQAEPSEYLPLFIEVPGRLDAAIDSLEAAGYTDIAVVAHSLGAAMAVYSLAEASSDRVTSLVIVGMSPGGADQANIRRLQKIRLPVFDLYGGNDLEAVLATAQQRAAAGAASSRFWQRRVDGANHFFQGFETELVRQVLDWLEVQSD